MNSCIWDLVDDGIIDEYATIHVIEINARGDELKHVSGNSYDRLIQSFLFSKFASFTKHDDGSCTIIFNTRKL